MRESEILARAFFPGAAEYIQVPYVRPTIIVPDPSLENLSKIFPGSEVVKVDEVFLDYITEGPPHVLAGMSAVFRRVYICEVPDGC